MKMIKETLPLQSRRLFLAVLLTSPLFLFALSLGKKNNFPAPVPDGLDGFVIINGWVMLKRDLTEDRA